MAKEYDLFLKSRERECDVYLRNRVTECCVEVWSMILHDWVVPDECRIVLSSLIERLLLYKYIAIESKSALVSSIDKLLKVCFIMPNFGIGVKSEIIKLIEEHNISPNFEIAVASELDGHPDYSLLLGILNDVALDILLNAAQKECLTYFSPDILFDSDVAKLIEEHSLSPAFDVFVDAILNEHPDYSTLISALNSIGLEDSVSAALKECPGYFDSDAIVDSVLDPVLKEIFQNPGDLFGTVFDVSVFTVLTRYRILGDMDGFDLSDFDALLLEDTDYITEGE